MFDLTGVLREFTELAAFTGLSAGALAGLVALVWFFPPARTLAIQLAVVVITRTVTANARNILVPRMDNEARIVAVPGSISAFFPRLHLHGEIRERTIVWNEVKYFSNSFFTFTNPH